MERPKKSAVAGLPDDPLVEILSRVPVKELHRSKCVSKGWRDLIADPLHRKKLPQTLQGFFHVGDFINLFVGSPPPVDPYFRFLKKRPSSHFQLVAFCAEEGSLATVHTCSSKTGVWRHSQTNWAEEVKRLGHWKGWNPQISARVRGAAVFNGVLNFMLDDDQIAEVDVEGKTRGIVPAPSSVGRQSAGRRPLFIGQSQGRLHCISEERWVGDFPSELSSGVYTRDFDDDCHLLSIWVLEDYDTQKWVLKHGVSLMRLFGSRFNKASCDYDVVAIHPDSNLLFIFLYWKPQLISYGLDSKEVRALGTLEQDPLWFYSLCSLFLGFRISGGS